MRKLCFGILELVLLSALSTIEGPQLSADVYPGPAGLDWRRGPADAKIILSNRFQFINERSFKDEPLDTIVQYYSGDFGGLPTRQIKALFYRGSFFYLAVEVLPSAATSKSFFHIEELMSGRHGSPKLITKPRSIQSKATMLSHIQSAGKRPGLVDLTLKDKFAAFDLQIQTGLWQPKGLWATQDGTKIDVLIYGIRPEMPMHNHLGLRWIFYNESIYQEWQAYQASKATKPPTDY